MPPKPHARVLRALLTVRAPLRRLWASEYGAPRRLLPVAVNYYFRPVHAEFASRTTWSLYDSVTEMLKTLPLSSAFQSAARVGRFFETRLK